MKRYFNTISAFQANQLIRYSTLILIGVVFAKASLSQGEIGEYESFIFLAGAVSFFWLNGLLKAFLPLSGERNPTNILSAYIVIQSLSIIAALFLLLIHPLLSGYLLNGREIPWKGLLLLFIIFGMPSNLIEYFYLIKKRSRAILSYSFISFAVQFIVVAMPAVLGFGIKTSVTGLVAVSFLRFIWFWILIFKNSELYVSAPFIREHIKLGAPLIAATFLSGSAQFIDGFIVTSRFDDEMFAVFRFGARELPLAMLLANALSNAMLPEIGKKEQLSRSIDNLKKSVTRLSHLLFPITAVLLLTSHKLYPVIFNADFKESATIFNIYLLLIISRLMLPQTILTGLKITRPIMIASFAELLLNISLSLILVEYLGIAGIAYATFIAYLAEKIILAFVVKKKLNISLSRYLPINVTGLYSLGIIVIFIFTEYFFY